MDGNMGETTAHQSNLSKEFEEDGNGLELSLGLGLGLALSSAHKWKASETSANPLAPPPHHFHSSSFSSADPMAGDPSLPSGSNSSNHKAALKPNGKGNSGLDAALKKFLEGKLEDEEGEGGGGGEEEEGKGEREETRGEEGKKYSGLGPSSEQAFEQKKLRKEEEERKGGKERSCDEGEGVEEEGKRNPFLFKEIHVLSSSRGSIAPLFVDAFKMTPDDGEDESLEQQRRLQEARSKRKFVVEENPNQKKGKITRDDSIGSTSHGFVRPGSSTWLPGLDADRSLLSLSGEQEVTKHDDKVGQDEPKTNEKAYEYEDNESMGVGQNNKSTVKGEASMGVEVNFMSQFKAQDIATGRETNRSVGGDDVRHLGISKEQAHGRENFMIGGSSLHSKKEKDARLGALMIGGSREKGKVPSETSSTGTDGTDKIEEKGHGGTGEASSVPNENMVSDKVILTSTSSPFPVVVATDGRSYPVQSSFHAGPVPFFPSNFPYVLSHASSGSDGQAQNATVQSSAGSAFQPTFAGPERAPVSSSDGTASWMNVLRPHGCPPSTKPQGTRANENGSAAADTSSAHGNHPFYRALSQNGSQDPAMAISHLHRPPGQPVISSSGNLPQFASQIMQTDTVEHRSLKDQGGVMNAFPGFASSQGLPGSARTPSNNGMKEDKVETQQNMHNRNNSQEPNNIVAQEEIRRALGGQFHQGTTDNLSVIDGLGEDLASLQRGVVPGLTFGGTGTTPDLPWVHTTAPNGRTIGGVLYRFSPNQLKIVCACHGKHMSPVEFTQHASVDMPN